MKKAAAIILGAFGALLLIALVATIASTPDKPAGPHTLAGITPSSPVTETDVAPVAPAAPAGGVSDGTYEVGVDMEAGKYKATCPAGGYWARMRDDSGSNFIDNELTMNDALMQFTAKKGEFVKISRCTFAKVG